MRIQIRPIATIDQYRACEELQFQAWQMPDYREVVPMHLLIAAHKSGGLLLGAFDGDQVAGFCFGFPALDASGHLHHYSHMLAVAAGYQGLGVGRQLKLAQREAVLAAGLDLITWTYDPLESRNAHLNITRLGVVCRTYIRDLYGQMTDGLNTGLPTDRFQVEWWLASPSVERLLAGDSQPAAPAPPLAVAKAPLANRVRRSRSGLAEVIGLDLGLDAPLVRVEIPADYQTIKAGDTGLARAWRLASRKMFEVYFAAGYAAVDFVSEGSGRDRRSFYVLQSGWQPE